jgi:signal transduction histidine kinase
MFRSLKFRLTIGALVAIAISLATIWITLSGMFTRYVVDRYQSEMSVLADYIAANVTYTQGRFSIDLQNSDPRLDMPAGGRYWQLSAQGQEPLRSSSLWDTSIDPTKLGKPDRYGFWETVGPDGALMLVYGIDSKLADATGKGSSPFWIFCAFPKAELTTALDGFHSQLNMMIALTAGLLTAAALLQNFIGLRPLNRLRAQVAEIRAGTSHAIGEDGPTETLLLVREINLLLSERESAVERARARASDLAHGLKTPLMVLIQLVQGLNAKDKETALKQVDLIRQRADRQLQSARLGVEQMASTNVADIAGKLVQVLKPATVERKLNWLLMIDADMAVATDPADLAEAMGNVLENASKWAKANILVRAEQYPDWTTITIADDGPGVDETDYERILRRGVYLADDFQGTGLGLAISSDIAAAYDGSVTLGRSEMGGLEVTLKFTTSAASRTTPI